MVVHGADGMDEISFTGDTYVAELKDGMVKEYVLNPRQFNLPVHELGTIQVQNAADSRVMILDVLNGKTGPQRDIVILNAGAAIYVAGMADSHQAGIAIAAGVLDSGAALQKLEQLRVMSNNQ
jgi:anthranilate phosphoribosyltransferase